VLASIAGSSQTARRRGKHHRHPFLPAANQFIVWRYGEDLELVRRVLEGCAAVRQPFDRRGSRPYVLRSRTLPLRPWISSSVLFCRAMRRAVWAASA
jgi:hypothetical protein